MSVAVNSCAPVSFTSVQQSSVKHRLRVHDCCFGLRNTATRGNLAFVPAILRLHHVDCLSSGCTGFAYGNESIVATTGRGKERHIHTKVILYPRDVYNAQIRKFISFPGGNPGRFLRRSENYADARLQAVLKKEICAMSRSTRAFNFAISVICQLPFLF